MIKLFIGGKGSGKTKTLIEMVNNAVEASKGNVICIEKGDKLIHDITYKARLIDTDAYSVADAEALYGFIAGILASNSDITDIFVDSALLATTTRALRICSRSLRRSLPTLISL